MKRADSERELHDDHEIAPGGDPGKQARAAAGIPIVPSMDGFRALAIAAVITFHVVLVTTPPTGTTARVLFYGTSPNMIDALFIMSGFVIFLPTVASGGNFGSVRFYALRRAARVLPGYWLGIALTLLMLAAWPVSPAPADTGLGTLGIHLGFLHMPALLADPDFVLGWQINGPLWTLSIEVVFYILMPLIAGAYLRRPLLGLALAALITLFWKEGLLHLGRIDTLLGLDTQAAPLERFNVAANNQFPAWAFSFGLGMTGAWAYVRWQGTQYREVVARWAPRAQLISLVALGISMYVIGRYAIDPAEIAPHFTARQNPAISMSFSASLAAFMVSTALAPPRLQRPFNLPSIRALGDISYGMYLIHAPLILFLLALLTGMVESIGSFWTVLLTGVPLTILYGWLSAHWLEQPARRWAQRYGRRATAARAPVADSPPGRAG
jgi:peptidoglycan/LPS O-acetylase OafA/YrhL